MSENRGILVYSEKHDLTLEILGKGRELADQLRTQLMAVAIGHNIHEKATELLKYGADKVYLFDSPSTECFQSDMYLSVLLDLTANQKPDMILIGSSKRGKPLAARLATRLEAGCVPDCNRVTVDQQGKLIGERMTYGGNATAKVTFTTKPQIVTVPARAFDRPSPQDRHGQLVRLDARPALPKTEVVEIKPLEASSTRIEEAEVIISCGRGLTKKEGKILLDEVAGVLCGQVGCSRPLAEDRKWFTEWIGLSGHKVRPKLYIACGISGVIQHVAGIRDSKIIVAINQDPEAPIFEVADYGVIGDLYEVLPALKDALKKMLQYSG